MTRPDIDLSPAICQGAMTAPGRLRSWSLEKEAAFARHLLHQRRRREDRLGKEIFAEPAWDMLLDLFASEVEGTRVAKLSLVVAAAVPQTTALRWIGDLIAAGHLGLYPDEADGRRTFVTLSDATFGIMADLLRTGRSEAARLCEVAEHQ